MPFYRIRERPATGYETHWCNNMTIPSTREPILVTALPSVIAGLAGIPVGLSLQSVFQTIAFAAHKSGIDYPPSAQLSHAFWYLVFLVGFYAMYCGVMLLTIEAGSRCIADKRGTDGGWDRFIARTSAYHIPCAVCLVGALVAAGVTFDPADLSVSGLWILLSATALSSSYLPTVFVADIRQVLLSTYKSLTALTYLGTAVLAVALYWGMLYLFSG